MNGDIERCGDRERGREKITDGKNEKRLKFERTGRDRWTEGKNGLETVTLGKIE